MAHALTKYPNGHADVLMGAVLANSPEVFAALERKNRLWGLGVSPTDCELVLRGLLTLPLRFAHQGQSALAIAQALSSWPEVAQVLHPALPGCPGHAHYTQHFSAPASVFAVALNSQISDEKACAWVDNLKLFRIAYSWGGPESLAVVAQLPPDRAQHLASTLGHASLGPVVRLAIGLENPQELLNDLQQSRQGSISLNSFNTSP